MNSEGVFMLQFFKSLFAAPALLFLISLPLFAQDLSLVIGNKSYRHAGWMYEAETALNSETKLRNIGFTVVSSRDMDHLKTRQALEEFVDRLPDAGAIVVLLSDHFVHADHLSARNAFRPNHRCAYRSSAAPTVKTCG
jgi:uncharacterized caspase-like protein